MRGETYGLCHNIHPYSGEGSSRDKSKLGNLTGTYHGALVAFY